MRRTLTLSTALTAVALAATLYVAPASAASYDPLVYRAQMALNAKGFDTGNPDGLYGPRTRTALQAWERASGMPTTSTVTASVVTKLEGGNAAPPPRADRNRDSRRDDRRDRADSVPSSETIRQTQHELNRLGYNLTYEGGRLNGETGDAVRNWQARHGLEQTGVPDRQLLSQMHRDTQRIDPNITWRTSSSTNVPVDNSMSQQDLIAQTQFELRRHGYSIASNTAVLDADTTNAIRAYQSANGMGQTGMPSAQLLTTLRTDNRMVSQQTYPAQPNYPNYPTSYTTPIPPQQQVQCADFMHQGRPGGSDYNGPPVPGCN